MSEIFSKITENEARISRLEKMLDINSLNITREEYKTVQNIMSRLDCEELITASDYFSEYLRYSFKPYFEALPMAVSVILDKANNLLALGECASGDEKLHAITEAKRLQKFVEALNSVSETLFNITEDRPFFNAITNLLYQLEEAQKTYEK